MKNKLISILLHPVFLALVISLVIISFLPDFFAKYKVELVEKKYIGISQRVYFEDLNGDHKSEKIVAQDTNSGHASFIIYNETGDMIDQWNYKADFPSKRKFLWFHDTDKDNFKEIYAITQKRDSAFLEIAKPFTKDEFKIKSVYIDSVGEFENNFQLIQGKKLLASDLDSDGNEEVLFSLSSGYACYPRFTYKYNKQNEKITRSQYLVNPIYIDYVMDIDNSGTKEIFLKGYAASNKIDSTLTKRSDYSSWLTILDEELNFLFKPIEFPSPFSGVQTLPLKNDKNNYDILCKFNSKRANEYPDKLCLYSIDGKLIKEHILPKGEYVIHKSNNEGEFLLLEREKGSVVKYNMELDQLDHLASVEQRMMIFPMDITQDGNYEWLVGNPSNFSKNYQLYDKNFQNPVEIPIPNDSKNQLYFGLKRAGNTNELYLQKGTDLFVYKYGENPLYIFRFLFYLGIFLLVFGLLWLARKGQKIQMEKKRAIEDQISKLQIKTLKNQVDPHFVFNAVNTISEMMLIDDKIEADRFISKFSKLMRETLQKSDKIITTLQEELDYVENYIQLQQIRFNNGFEYQIKKDLNVDYQIKVPNHVIYTYVENAIKHGLSRKADGELKISVALQGEDIIITIDNNGGGIEPSGIPKKNSTGNGMKIMEKMYALYEKLYRKKIIHQMTEIKDSDGNINGVRVRVIISK